MLAQPKTHGSAIRIYDLVVGNPPWAGRGRKQIAHKFMETVPDLLKKSGRGCLLLPSKAFLNQTDEFQSRWLRRVTLDNVIQLADYSFILFKEARCPCSVVRFTNRVPQIALHEVEYVVPKVSRIDLRDGVIPVGPQDRKWIPLRLLLSAAERGMTGVVWKSHLWGTRCDLKFLDFLFTLPRLGGCVDVLSETHGKRRNRWVTGIGCKPWKGDPESEPDRELKPLDNWTGDDPLVTVALIEGLPTLPRSLCLTLGEHLEKEGYLLNKLYSKPDDALFTPPLVLWNRGFTTAAYFDYEVRFQHALHSVAGPIKDADALLFLSAYLRSRLARYFVFHTSASLGTERDQVHLAEALRLPFFLPESEAAPPDAERLVANIADKIRSLKKEMEAGAKELGDRFGSTRFRLRPADEGTEKQERKKWLERQRVRSRELQAEIDPLIYKYFGLNEEQEVALIEDTCDIFDKSDTPSSLVGAKDIPTLQPLRDDTSLAPYATTLTMTLNGWASGTLRVSASGGVDGDLGLGLVELTQTRQANAFKARAISAELADALGRLQRACIQQSNRLAYLRGSWVFDTNAKRICIVKPAVKGHWTRTAASNDAADLYAHIAEARRQSG